MNLGKKEAIVSAAKIIADAVVSVRATGGDDTMVRSVIREKLFDEELVNPSERKQVLDKANSEMGTKFSMNAIKSARRLDHHEEPTSSKPVEVTEVIGSVVVTGGIKRGEEPLIVAQAATDISKSQFVETLSQAKSLGESDVTCTPEELRDTQREVLVNGLKEGEQYAGSTIDAKGVPHHLINKGGEMFAVTFDENSMDIIETPVPPQAAANNTNVTEEETMAVNDKSKSKTTVTLLIAAGFVTKEARAQLLTDFKAAHPNAGENVYEHNDVDEALLSLSDADRETLLNFVNTDNNAAPAQSEAAAEAAWHASAAASNNGGISSTWVGVGAAVVGGGLAMLGKGEISLGGLLGTAAGAAGAYFVSDQFDDKFEGDFGRYLSAGGIGLALGGVGAHLVGGIVDAVMPVTLLGGKAELEAPTQVVVIPGNTNAGALQVQASIPGM